MAGFIFPDCEAGLRELERRGYEVRRVGGFSNIDLGRNRMAADALADGFDETMWIDADVAFNPDDVEKLREHQLDFVSGIYPKKGLREVACHVLPGTRELVFGEGGGLIEVLYANGGFTLVRRAVYEGMRDRLQLPACNARFGQPFWPWFQPVIRPDGAGHWYLSDDWSFCERARQAGIRVFADTSIRLRHIGNYGYTWEDTGVTLPLYKSFRLNLAGTAGKPECADTIADATNPALDALACAYPWPATRPRIAPRLNDGWLRAPARRELLLALSRETKIVLELGVWLGLSTRFIAEQASRATVIAIDHWRGSPEHDSPEEQALLPVLYDTFITSTWDYRERVIPFRTETRDGLREVARRGIRPDLIYIDADHSYDAVRSDLEESLALFPSARIVGDDWDWETVRQAVSDVCRERSRVVTPFQTAWHIETDASTA